MRMILFLTAAVACVLRAAAPSGSDDKSAAEVELTKRQSHDTLAVLTDKGGLTTKVPWKSVVGKRATVQGIAWKESKGRLANRVILDGTTIYVDAGASFSNPGRLVEVTGIFERRRMPADPPTSQGYSTPFEYYILGEATIREIDTTTAPRLVIEEK
jgi:hypothetical protein